ncbi:hypothetical protein Pcinc_043506 [Petrolisthes cinctipes]|uniref:Uncharacterized protein n=1 Tax=Petrolisthes cinctipes TaxID=88211 RepID=A0AAE1BIN4_PETCI|nr:hypothetical protein Pcinc_043506 [Petrolisthes cinctipes]
MLSSLLPPSTFTHSPISIICSHYHNNSSTLQPSNFFLFHLNFILSLPVCYTSSTLSLLPSLASSSFNFLPVYPSALTNTPQPICFTQPSLPDYVPPPSIISLSILLPSLTQLNPSLSPFLPILVTFHLPQFPPFLSLYPQEHTSTHPFHPTFPTRIRSSSLHFLHFYPCTLTNTPQLIPFTLPSLTRIRSSSLHSYPIPHRYITCFVSLAPPPPPLSLD